MSFGTALFTHPLLTCCSRTFLSACHLIELAVHLWIGQIDLLLVAKAVAMLPTIVAELREWKIWLLLAIALARSKFEK